MTRTICLSALLTIFFATSALSQTAAEQLQKGIYTQETAGDVDGAITIYRQIVNSSSTPRDVAAQAEYRLGQALLQKGDLAGAASEFDKLARNYPDYASVVSNLANQARIAATLANVRAPNLTNEQRQKMLQELARSVQTQGGTARYNGTAADFAVTAPPPNPPGTIRVGQNVQSANLVNKVPPEYPALAKAAHVQGTVTFNATIGKDGHVENLELVSGPPLLVQSAMNAVRQWVYKPTLLNGEAVSVTTTIEVNYTLAE
jgi:TonB family protein